MRIFTVLIFVLCCFCRLSASSLETKHTELRQLTQENGLLNNTLLDIHQDEIGFIWLGTDVGISRYDGVHFHNYELTDGDIPLAVERIYEMKQEKLLWLKLGRRNEIACFNKKTGLCIPLGSEVQGTLQNIKDLCLSGDKLYVITPKGIEALDYQWKNDSLSIHTTLLYESALELRCLQSDGVCLYAIDEKSDVLMFCPDDRSVKRLAHSRLGFGQAPVESIRANNGHVWISTAWQGLFIYSPETDTVRNMSEVVPHLKRNVANDIKPANDSLFYMATPMAVFRLKFETSKLTESPVEVFEMSNENFKYNPYLRDRINSLHIDLKNNVMWMGTFGKGLVKVSLNDPDVTTIPLYGSMRDVTGMVQDISGHLWLSAQHGGIFRSKTNVVAPGMEFERWAKSDPTKSYRLHKDTHGQLWIGDQTGTIQMLNPLTSDIKTYQPTYDGKNNVGAIQKMLLCQHSHLWLVTEKGLFVYDPKEDKCLGSIAFGGELHRINALCEDGDGTMWLGTDAGIRNATLGNGKLNLKGGYEKRAGIHNGEVLAVYLNRYNQLYVSYADKIVQTDENREYTEDVKIVNRHIKNGHVNCIIDDKNGNTWMGNNSGIMTIYNKDKTTYNYAFPERFYDVCYLNDNRLLWLNTRGLVYFHPRTLKEKSQTAPLYISDIEVNYNNVDIGEEINGQVILKEPIYQMEELVLEHANNNVVFYLTNLSYNEMANKVTYRLLPLQEEWTETYESDIELSNLPAGEYMLEVRPVAINDQEVPSTTLKIRVKKHWATTPWAIVGYVVLFCLAGWGYTQFLKGKTARRRMHQRKEELLKENLKEERKNRKDLEVTQQMKNQARYGMARELRTPLSLVSVPLKEMLESATFPDTYLPKVKVAYRNTISIQDTCNQLLSLYEQENEDNTLNVASYPIYEIADNTLASANNVLTITPIKLHYDKNNRIKKEIWVDRKKITFTLRNILSNAFRHTSFAGNIHFLTSVETIDGKEYCCFRIKDNGKEGIERSAVYNLTNEEGGDELTNKLCPELGIILMKEHICAHHGDIRIEQDKENGTTVTVCIPMGKDHFANDPKVMFVEAESSAPIDLKQIVTADDKEHQPDEDILPVPATPSEKYKLLVIEDHKDIRLYLKVLFGSTYNIIMAENGEEGVKLARKEMPDLILSDVMMPVMDGFECTRILKEDLKTCHIPIIILTALVGDSDVVKGLELGADDYILKPFNPEILRSKVKRLIKNRLDLKQSYMKLLMADRNGEPTKPEDAEDENPKEDPFIMQIFKIVEENLQNPDFSVKRLSEMLNMSQPTLYRRVKMLTNYTIIELIRGVRLKHATQLLKMKKYSIQEVSEMVGYNDAPTFRKHFVEFYGMTPSAFVNKDDGEEKK